MARFSVALWQWVMVLLLIALLEGAHAASICNIDSAQLNYCRRAVSGKSPTPPSKKCCGVVHRANLPCLCNYKAVLPSFGIDPALAMALPKKCGMKTPPECGKITKIPDFLSQCCWRLLNSILHILLSCSFRF